jgi:hypothetical protein
LDEALHQAAKEDELDSIKEGDPTMSTAQLTAIRARLGFRKMSDNDVLARSTNIANSIGGNASFPAPPVDINTFKILLGSYAAAIAEALDGGSKAIAVRNTLREAVIQDLRLLAIYAESVAKRDMAIFLSSGFIPVTITRTPVQSLLPPTVRKVNQGPISGQLLVTVSGVAGARSCDMRYGIQVAGTTPTTWIIVAPVGLRGPVSVDNLTPGTIYAFQVRALNAAGYSDWSDSVARMAI